MESSQELAKIFKCPSLTGEAKKKFLNDFQAELKRNANKRGESFFSAMQPELGLTSADAVRTRMIEDLSKYKTLYEVGFS